MEEFDLAAVLGAELVPSSEILSLYIPNKNMDGDDIDVGPWIQEAETILARMGGGFTRMPPYEGGYLELEEGGEIQREQTVIIYTYILEELFLKELPNLRQFVHRFGRETRQYAVAVEFRTGGTSLFFRITKYDVE